MAKWQKWLLILCTGFLGGACAHQQSKNEENLRELSWKQIEDTAQGSEVSMMMWNGDPLINNFMQEFVKPGLRERYNIRLNIVGGQGNEIVSTLMNELEAGKTSSEIDVVWINGETFYQLRQIEALYGPFTDQLPHDSLINWNSPYIAYDFQQAVNGMECPWGNVQFTWIYDSLRVQNPPQNLQQLEKWVKAHPGKFTLANDFSGMTLLKSWLIELAGGKGALNGDFDPATYKKYSRELWRYLNRIKPHFWNEGETFPGSVAEMHQLYAQNELSFTFSNNDSEVDNKVMRGIFPESSRAYVPEMGSIRNSHYLGIVRRSQRKAAAMAVINYLISPEAQYRKMQPEVWGDATILDVQALPAEWQQKFAHFPNRKRAPDRTAIKERALREPAPEYMIRLFEDFRKKVIEN